MSDSIQAHEGEILFYTTPQGGIRIEVSFQGETLWLSQRRLAEMLGVEVQTINYHLKEIYKSGELSEEATIRKIRIVQTEGTRQVKRTVDFYNLDAIISVGYRVNSHQATQFRMWATQALREFIIKGFVMDDERLKEAGQSNYFDELLARIRDIRSSEKMFWSKVLDIYATSIDYDPKTATSKRFFAIVQNKMHWAAHGHTAAEIVNERADAEQRYMGLTSWRGEQVRKRDVSVAKNYLTREELDILNRLVTIYLEFAELQALDRKPMYMADWVSKLDDFLRVSDREVLTHAGKVSHKSALAAAHAEYDKYRQERLNTPSPVEMHFLEAVNEAKQIEKVKGSKSSL